MLIFTYGMQIDKTVCKISYECNAFHKKNLGGKHEPRRGFYTIGTILERMGQITNVEVDGRVECCAMVAETTLEKHGCSANEFTVEFLDPIYGFRKTKQ